MAIRRAAHAVCDRRYHIVGVPKYRKWILRGDITDFVDRCIKEDAISNDFQIEEMQIASDCVHIFFGFTPKYSRFNVVKWLKGASARAIFKRYPEVKR